MSYSIGDKVIHSTHGFAEIINVESKEVLGVSSRYYVIQTRSLLLWIPIFSQNKESIRLPNLLNYLIFCDLIICLSRKIAMKGNHKFTICLMMGQSNLFVNLYAISLSVGRTISSTILIHQHTDMPLSSLLMNGNIPCLFPNHRHWES
jgi:hypothetical protein